MAALICWPSAPVRALDIRVVNGSFEAPYLFDLFGCPAGGQPTGAQNPDGWTVVRETGTADTIALDGRWNPDWFPGGVITRKLVFEDRVH